MVTHARVGRIARPPGLGIDAVSRPRGASGERSIAGAKRLQTRGAQPPAPDLVRFRCPVCCGGDDAVIQFSQKGAACPEQRFAPWAGDGRAPAMPSLASFLT